MKLSAKNIKKKTILKYISFDQLHFIQVEFVKYSDNFISKLLKKNLNKFNFNISYIR